VGKIRGDCLGFSLYHLKKSVIDTVFGDQADIDITIAPVKPAMRETAQKVESEKLVAEPTHCRLAKLLGEFNRRVTDCFIAIGQNAPS
jgi:hypothetical protein